MPIPPEAWTTLGYILGGLVLVLIMRRGDVEKVTDRKLDRVASAAAVAAAPSPMLLSPSSTGIPAEDGTLRLTNLFLERLSRDLDADRLYNRDQFTRIWAELMALRNGGEPPSRPQV